MNELRITKAFRDIVRMGSGCWAGSWFHHSRHLNLHRSFLSSYGLLIAEGAG
jgi:hypothetical protein